MVLPVFNKMTLASLNTLAMTFPSDNMTYFSFLMLNHQLPPSAFTAVVYFGKYMSLPRTKLIEN